MSEPFPLGKLPSGDALDSPRPGAPASSGARILVADDHADNREILRRRLEHRGHHVVGASDGVQALELARTGGFDLLLLDVLMPGMDGIQVLEKIKADGETRELPVIMISALESLESVVHCIEAGADDYLPKPCEPALLHARIHSSLARKRASDRERQFHQALVESQKALAGELNEAAAYVRSLLPPPTREPVAIDWRYQPSAQLGGDALGYQWLDEDHLAFYVIDVCGHGVASALHCISVLHILRSRALPEIDFREPEEVLAGLDQRFPMMENSALYFTMWYGVWQKSRRTLRYTNAGHPAPVLFSGRGPTLERATLPEGGTAVGIMTGCHWTSSTRVLSPGDRLYLFSDGLYEVQRGGTVPTYEEFVEILARTPPVGAPDLDGILTAMREINGPGEMGDDITLMALTLP